MLGTTGERKDSDHRTLASETKNCLGERTSESFETGRPKFWVVGGGTSLWLVRSLADQRQYLISQS